MVRARERRGKGERMPKQMTRQVTIDLEAWRRNLRAAPDPTQDKDADTRWLNNYFAFWAVCEAGACKRGKRCAGKPKACFERFWPAVPERMKFEFRGYLKAFSDGLSLEQARRKVKADADVWAEHIAQAEARRLAALSEAGRTL
jgi:hypothetical protein